MDMAGTAELRLLNALYETGGAPLDRYGRLMDRSRALPGQPIEWLQLVAKGYVAGEFGKILLTATARAMVEAQQAGRS